MFESCLSSSHRAFRFAANLAILLLVGIPVLIFYTAGKPFKRGFYCSDDSLRYPYRESTVPNWALYVITLALPLAIITVTEYATGKLRRTSRLVGDGWIWRSESWEPFFVFLFGAGCTQLLTDVAKYTIGRLRPHFFAICSPNVDCSDPKMQNVYVEHFECRTRDEYLLKDMRLSFPSGHSSLSAYSMVFLAMYFSARLVWPGSIQVRHVLQYLAILLAMYVGLSRVSDYKHHWSDVLAGLTLGAATAVMIVLFFSELFSVKIRGRNAKEVVSQPEDFTLAEDPEEESRKYTVI